MTASQTALGTHILGTGTAVPDAAYDQSLIRDIAHAVFDTTESTSTVYDNAGVSSRRSAMPVEWYQGRHGWEERAGAFKHHALDLLEQAARQAAERAGIGLDEIDALITVSTTGFAIPSLDALLINRMGLRRDTTRMPVFGWGCAGGALGLSRAATMARGMPGKNVMLLVVELCSVNFRADDRSATNFVSTALFGDGAAAVVVRNDGVDTDRSMPAGERAGNRLRATVQQVGEWTWEDSEGVMGFGIEDDGLRIILRPDVPHFTYKNLRPQVERFLEDHELGLEDIDGYICHPGGRKVLEAIAASLSLPEEKLDSSRGVLNDYGNMSAPTVLFVLDRTLANGASGRHLMTAFGPGFSLALLLLDLP